MAKDLYEQVLEAIRDEIRTISIDVLPRVPVEIRRLPESEGYQPHGIIVSPDQETEGDQGTNEEDMIGYPAVVTLAFDSTKGPAEKIGDVTSYRREIRKKFHNKREHIEDHVDTTSVRHAVSVVQYGPNGLSDWWQRKWRGNMLVIWSWFWESRS